MQAVVERHSDALFKASHAAAFGVRVQALALLLQLMTAQSAASDRFYRYQLTAGHVALVWFIAVSGIAGCLTRLQGLVPESVYCACL